jgi:hypothetical protein
MGRLGIKLNKNIFAAGREKAKASGEYNDVTLEPGRYVCIIRRARAQEVSGKPKIIFDLEVAGETEKAGGTISVWFDLSEEKVHHLLKTLNKLGYDIDALDDEDTLADMLEDIEETTPVVRITAKAGGEYINYYIDKKLDELTAAEVAAGGGGETAVDEDAKGGKAGLKPDSPPARAAAAKADSKKKPTPPPEEPEPKSDRENLAEALENMDKAALQEYITDNELEILVKKADKEPDVRVKILDAKFPEEPPANQDNPPAEEEASITPGMKCKAQIKGKVVDVTVVSVDEAAGTVKVKGPLGVVSVPVAQLSL